jgi:hypothetical protein
MINHPCFNQAPTIGKMAMNGNWESAAIFKPGSFTTEREVREYIGDRREVACEAFFKDAFLGVRRQGDPEYLISFVLGFAKALESSCSGSELSETLTKRFNIPVGVHFRFAEIGAVDAWKSVGPLNIPDPHVALVGFDQLLRELAQSSVGQERHHAKAIEFAYDNQDGTTHWIALPISDGVTINQSKLKTALEVFCDQSF